MKITLNYDVSDDPEYCHIVKNRKIEFCYHLALNTCTLFHRVLLLGENQFARKCKECKKRGGIA